MWIQKLICMFMLTRRELYDRRRCELGNGISKTGIGDVVMCSLQPDCVVTDTKDQPRHATSSS